MSFILLMLDLIDTVNKDTIVIRSESFFIRTSVVVLAFSPGLFPFSSPGTFGLL